MKYCLLFYLLAMGSLSVVSQPLMRTVTTAPEKTNTYALIIGVSTYKDADIKPLEFAHRDAEVFADFLMSAPGGAVPKENIKLLTNEQATWGEVDASLLWLQAKCRENDKVYFYFSGHGALENETILKNGYLICYNTPATAFQRLGLSLHTLNLTANTLTIQNKANVIIITDACHSGRVVNTKFKESPFVGQQLLETRQREIRIASCTPEQLSIEKANWGGGRGVFSYYLVNGLRGGLADMDKSGLVTVGELKTYLDNSMANDPVLKNDGDTQTAVIKGRPDFVLATVVEPEALAVQKSVAADAAANLDMVSAMSAQVSEGPEDPEDFFFSLVKSANLELLTETLNLDKLETGAIVTALIENVGPHPMTETQSAKLARLADRLKYDADAMRSCRIKLGAHFNDRGADVIRQYLKGSEAELEKRRYYNSGLQYEIYPRMFATALKLTEGDEYRSTSAAVFLHYFTGVTHRLQMPRTPDPKPLLEAAIEEQKKALKLEEYAAYIYNELGILYQYKNNFAEAEKNYEQAIRLSPEWALPYANRCGLYAIQKKYALAAASCSMADSLQKNLHSVSVNRGIIHQNQRNFLLAEEYYRQAIEINSRHYLPFEKLGAVYLNTTDYNLSDSFYYEAALRKKGYYFGGNFWSRWVVDGSVPIDPHFQCAVETAKLAPTDAISYFTLGVQSYDNKDLQEAEKYLRKVISIDKKNPLVYHYLGKVFFDQHKWEEAELMFKKAILYYLDEKQFTSYMDSVKRSANYAYDHECVERYFSAKQYKRDEDHYFAGSVYELWNHPEEAESAYRYLVQNFPESGAYVKLWTLLEKQGRLTEAEKVINDYVVYTNHFFDNELAAFYKRCINKFPEEVDWYYRLGLLMYGCSLKTAYYQYLDSIVWMPKLNKEVFIDVDMFNRLGSSDTFALIDMGTTGAVKEIDLPPQITVAAGYFGIPGTGESVPAALPILTPRKEAIEYLSIAASKLSDPETLADVYFKIGNVFLMAGSRRQAAPYFDSSLMFNPANANARLKLVDIYATTFRNTAAMQQMNYLADSNQVNFDTRLLLARFNIHALDLAKAKQLLDKSEAIYPGPVPALTDLRGRHSTLAGKPKDAIGYYQDYIKQLDTANKDMIKIPAYTLARLYAGSGRNNEAFSWLEKAITNGFNYGFVLAHDPLMNKLRNTRRWSELVGQLPQKKYHSNISSN